MNDLDAERVSQVEAISRDERIARYLAVTALALCLASISVLVFSFT
jgi:hypothetical protein